MNVWSSSYDDLRTRNRWVAGWVLICFSLVCVCSGSREIVSFWLIYVYVDLFCSDLPYVG